MVSVIIAIIIFSIIVIFHELGHFLVAKKCDIQVNEFWLGMGPTLISKQVGETKYCLKLLPFGGACVMEGEDEASDNERAFNNKPVWQRFLVVAAGPFNNFILALIFCIIMVAAVGVVKPVINQVEDGGVLAEAGVSDGDEIISLNNYKIRFYQEVSVYIYLDNMNHKTSDYGNELKLTYEHNGKTQTVYVKPKYDSDSKRYKLGFTAPKSRTRLDLGQTICYGFYQMKYYIYTTYKSLWLLCTGKLTLNDMSGPVGIVKTIGDTYNKSKVDGALYVFINMLNISGLLSANLMVMNLIPFPALDGGRLVLFIIEAIRGKKTNEKVEGVINTIGFALLMALMVLVMFNDIRKIFFM